MTTEGDARRLCREIAREMGDRRQWWVSLDKINHALPWTFERTLAAVAYAVDRAWLTEAGGHSAILRAEGWAMLKE